MLFNSGKSAEIYEKSDSKHVDKYFKKYLKTISKCPQQIIRLYNTICSL